MTGPARPTIEATTGTQVAVAAMAGGGMTWLFLGTLQRAGQSLPVLGAVAWLSVVLLAAGIAVLALRTHRAIQVRREPMEPRTAVNRLLLGKTSVLGGAGLGSAYLVMAVVAAAGWPAPLAQSRVLHAGIAVAACLGWGLAGWFLERACRIPPDGNDDTDNDTPSGREGGAGEGVT